MFGRKKIAMLVAEFLGTGILTMVFLAVSKSSMGYPLFVSFAVGLVLIGLTLSLGAVSGAHLNPAITLGLWTVRKVKTMPALAYVAVQLLGAAAAYMLYKYLIGQPLQSSGMHFDSKILIAETLGTFIFSLGWAAAAYQRYEAGKAAAVVGVSIILGALAASVANGGILNPAVALGAHAWVWGTFVLGPVLGSVIGFNLYGLLFAPSTTLVESGVPAKKKK
jgi:glycerol uptake facilitator protein